MHTISDRIAIKLNELGLKQVDLIKATGLSKGAVSKWIAGTAVPSSEHIPAIANKLQVSTEWLLTGKESSKYENSQVNQLNNSYIGGSINQSVVRQCSNGAVELVNLDFYPQANLNAPKQVFCTTKHIMPAKVDFVTIAIDDLMHPIIRHKSLVAVSKLQDGDLIYPNKIYVVSMQGLLLCRYLERMTGGRVRVYSEQDKTGQILDQADFDSEYQIMGAVVWQAGFLE